MVTIFIAMVATLLAVITAAESLALTLAGGVSTFLTWAVNSYFDASGKAAFLVTVAVSSLVSAVALLVSGDPSMRLLLSGDFSNLGEVYKAAVFVVGVATAVYKLLLADRAKRPAK